MCDVFLPDLDFHAIPPLLRTVLGNSAVHVLQGNHCERTAAPRQCAPMLKIAVGFLACFKDVLRALNGVRSRRRAFHRAILQPRVLVNLLVVVRHRRIEVFPFDEVEIKENRVSNDKIDLEVVVKEAPTGSITGGIGYGSDDGLLLSGGISDRNVFGTGLHGAFSVEKSDDALSGRISLTNPRVFDSEYSLGGAIFANDYDWNDYDEKSYGFSITGGRKLGRYTDASLTYYFEKSEIKGLNQYYAAAGYQDGKNLKSSIIPAITFNNTDDYYLPRSGVIASTSLEYAGLGGDIEYTKARGSFNYYFGLRDYIDYDIIFRYKAAAGYIWETGKKIPINEKLFLGGMKNVRGYDSRSIPKKQICLAANNCRYIETGGMQSFNNSFELSFPVIDRLKMRLVTFFDYGMIGDNSWNEEERYSAGAGIEWMTPMGPLQLYFVKPLNKKPHDDTNSFEFSIGSRFN